MRVCTSQTAESLNFKDSIDCVFYIWKLFHCLNCNIQMNRFRIYISSYILIAYYYFVAINFIFINSCDV